MPRLAWLSSLVVLLLAAPARANNADLEAAKAHFMSGEVYYNEGRFDDAVREFKAAHDASKLPDILYNLARAETKLGHEELAIGYLRQYLVDKPNAPDATSVQAEIDARERSLAARKKEALAEAEAEAAKKMAAAADENARRAAEQARLAEEDARRRTGRVLGVGLSALGAGALAAGVSLGVVAMNDAAKVGAAKDVPFDKALAGAQSEGSTFSTAAIALDVAGGVVAAAGVGLLIWSALGPAHQPAHVWLAPSGSGITAGGQF